MTRYPCARDRRYSIAKEYCGYSEPRFVLRFCGEFVAQSLSYSAMATRAIGEHARRSGALTFTNQSQEELDQ